MKTTFIIWKVKLQLGPDHTILVSSLILCSQVEKTNGVVNICTEFHHSEMLHCCLFILNKPTCIFFSRQIEKENALIICHHITCFYSKEDAVMKMQYMLFYNHILSHFLSWLFSPHSLLYCTNSPNISYAMSRLLTLQAASYLLYLLTECQSQMQISLNTTCFFWEYPIMLGNQQTICALACAHAIQH